MFQHVFAEMNNMLDEIVKHYPSAQGPQKQALVQNWNMLKSMSEAIIEEWLQFEEKMAIFRENAVSPWFFRRPKRLNCSLMLLSVAKVITSC